MLKKNFDLSGEGSFTQIKVKFRYYFIDSWGYGGGDRSWAAFATNASGGGLRVGWDKIPSILTDGNGDFDNAEFKAAANFEGISNWVDNWNDVEMTGKANGSSFWLFIGAAIDQAIGDETFAVGNVEIYVR